MTPKLTHTIAALGLLLTVLVVVGHGHLPPKRLVIHPNSDSLPTLYGYADTVSGQSSFWTDQQHSEWACSFKPGHLYGCGWQIFDSPRETNGLNLQAFEAIELELSYQGPATRIRVYARNFNSAYSIAGDANSSKYMSATFPISELTGPVQVQLDEFSVAAWWLRERYIPRQWSQVELNNVANLGVDLLERGEHQVKVSKITLVGRWVSTKTLLFIILGVWMTVFLVEGLLRFYQLYQKSARERQRIRLLEARQKNLEEENRVLEALADIDPLTGVLNRSGLQKYIEVAFSSPAGVSVLLLDIDHFKNLNDSYGHDTGDRVLKEFAALIEANLRKEDAFARWGGEEFVVLCHEPNQDSLRGLANKLVTICASHKFTQVDLPVSVSIGIAQTHEDDTFDDAFKRADQALYRAKQGGRNRVEFELK